MCDVSLTCLRHADDAVLLVPVCKIRVICVPQASHIALQSAAKLIKKMVRCHESRSMIAVHARHCDERSNTECC